MSPQKIIKTKIGQMLIERNLISNEQLAIALKEQEAKGGYISQHLISMGFVSEMHVAECLADQYGFAYLPLDRYEISGKIIKIIPFKLINIYSPLPVEKFGNSLDVVMADPLNEGVIEMLRQITKCDIQVLISTYSQIRNAINICFPDEIKNIQQGKLDVEAVMKKDMLKSFIQVKNYGDGKEKRKYRRKDVDLEMVYFLQNNSYKAKVKNISYGGMLFATNLFIPVERNIYTNIACKIFSKNININAIVQVIRVEKIASSANTYNIAGFFNFITDEDRLKLTILLQ